MPTRLITILSVAALVLASPALAQTGRRGTPASDPDMKELASYTLTMETLNRIDRANRAMVASLQKDPKYAERIKLGKELDALKKKDETTDAEDKRIADLEARIEQFDAANDMGGGDAKTLTDLERKISAMPPLAGALKAEGVTPREYAKFTLAILQAGFVVAARQMDAKHGTSVPLPEGVNPANVKFLQEHEADIKRMQAAYEASGIK
jgi:hypothetical protein